MRVALPHGVLDLSQRRFVPHVGAEVPLTTREAEALAYLVARPGQPVARDELLAEVWGYADTVLSRASDNAIRRLRAKIEPDPSDPRFILTLRGHGYQWAPPAAPEAVPSAPAAPTTAAPERRLSLGTREVDLVRHRVLGPDGEQPLSANEIALLQLLDEAGGAVVEATTLRRRLGVSRRALDALVYRLRPKLEDDPADPKHLVTQRRVGHRLVMDPALAAPVAGPPLIGSHDVVDRLLTTVQPGARVLVVGPPGIGKTRLAREVAQAWSGEVCWADATDRRGDGGLDRALVAALRLPPEGEPPLEALDRLARPLLVLDGADGVLDALRTRLGALPTGAALLATARRATRGGGLRLVAIPPLPPADAIALFRDRAADAAAGFDPTPDPDADLAALVAEVDHVPRAIELLATWAPLMPAAELLRRLRDVDARGGPRSGLLQAFERSLDWLPDDVHEACLQLSLFRGPFTTDDVEALRTDGLDELAELRAHHVVVARPEGGLAVLAPLRELALQRLGELPDGGDALRRAWAGWLAHHGATTWSERRDGLRPVPPSRLPDLLAAGQWAVDDRSPDLAAACTIGALRAWPGPDELPVLLDLAEGLLADDGLTPERWRQLSDASIELLNDRRRLDQSVARLQARIAHTDDPARAADLYGALGAAWSASPERSAEAYREAAARSEEAGEPLEAALHRAYAALATRPVVPPDLATELERLAERHGSTLRPSRRLHVGLLLGRIHQGLDQLGLAATHYRRAVEAARDHGEPTRRMNTLGWLAELLVFLGEVDEADAAIEEALDLADALDAPAFASLPWMLRASMAVVLGDEATARHAIEQGRAAIADSPENPVPLNRAILDLREAQLLLARRDPSSTRVLVGRARVILEEEGVSLGLGYCDLVEALAAALAGDPAEACALADRGVSRLGDDEPRLFRAQLLAMRAEVRAIVGRPALSIEDLEAAEGLARAIGVISPHSELRTRIRTAQRLSR